MDLSVKKIKENNLKFKGMKGAYHADNRPVFKFIAPPFNRKEEKVTLQIIPLKQNEDTKEYYTPKFEDIMELEFNSDNPLELSQDNVRELTKNFAYRYKITNTKNQSERYVTDEFKTIELSGGTKMNLIEQNSNYIISPKTGTMYHTFIDSDAILTPENTLKEYDPDFVRNHFNKLKGSIKGLTYLLRNTDELNSFKYIISTPDIGNDTISSHKYWPNNQYQCSNMEDFKEFVFELYKRGKSYVADGAFTSQGLQSPMVQHVLKWGKASPFYNMLKIDGTPNLGILPDRSREEEIKPLQYLGVKIVNKPGQKDYDKNKPTYIQFFDSRLSSKKQQNSNKLIESYDKNPDNHYDIVTHQDSIIPYYFEIDPEDENKLKIFKNKQAVLLEDIEQSGALNDFLTFPNFVITTKSKASGANYWDGNRDIIKMNLSNPTNNKDNIKGFFDARNYLYGVASFWTETIQSDLILKTALMGDKERDYTAVQNNIPEKEYEKLKQSLSSMKSFILEQGKTVEQYIKEFPLQSIETDPSLSAIFAQPQFNKEFLSKGTLENILNIVNNAINEAIPGNYKQNTEYKTYVTKLYAPIIIKNILVGAMCPEAIDKDGTINLDLLKNVSLNSLKANKESTPDEERRKVISKIRHRISAENAAEIKQKMQKQLQNISLEDLKLAESIVIQGKAGLNWRFDAAKDIGDLDAVRDKKADYKAIWEGTDNIPGVEDFWTKFINNVKKYNPAPYIIAEITDLWFFANKNNDMPEELFDPKLLKAFWEMTPKERKIHENQLPYLKEVEFLNKIGATTSSNYDAYFNNLSAFIGVDPENGTNKSYSAGNIIELKNRMESFASAFQPNSVILSHMFTDNHDKPRLLHTLPLDMGLFSKTTVEDSSDKQKEAITALTGRKDYKNISGKAAAVGLMMEKAINELYSNDNNKKNALIASLKNLVNGKDNDSSKPNFKKAEAFGVTSYEVSIRDLFKNAGYENEAEIWKLHHYILKDSLKLQEDLWEVMNAIMGTPTMYFGTNFAQTGWESSSKNMHVQNRNQAPREMKEKPEYKDYYKKMNAISGLYRETGLSAIRNGFPISLKYTSAIENVHPGAVLYFREQIQKYAQAQNVDFNNIVDIIKSKAQNKEEYEKFLTQNLKIDNSNNNFATLLRIIDQLNPNSPSGKESVDLWPIFKYDEKGSRTISVITNNNVTRREQSNTAHNFLSRYNVAGIPIKDKSNNCPLEEGTELKRKIYKGQKFVDDPKTYIVKDGNIQSKDGSPILITETVETFYVPKETNIKTKYMAGLYN